MTRPEIDLDRFTTDAKALGCVMFGKTTLTFHTPARIHPRALAALRELVAGGAISEEKTGGCALVFRPLVDLMPAFRWMGAMIEDGRAEEVNFALVKSEAVEVHVNSGAVEC